MIIIIIIIMIMIIVIIGQARQEAEQGCAGRPSFARILNFLEAARPELSFCLKQNQMIDTITIINVITSVIIITDNIMLLLCLLSALFSYCYYDYYCAYILLLTGMIMNIIVIIVTIIIMSGTLPCRTPLAEDPAVSSGRR